MSTTRLRQSDIPPHLCGWVCLGHAGVPRYWATVWEALHGAEIQDSTLSGKLTVIDRLYRHVEEVTGRDCLDALIADEDIGQLEGVLAGFFSKIRNEVTITKTDRSKDWVIAFEFVRDIIDRQGRLHNADDFDLLQARMARLNRLYASLSPVRSAKRKVVRALPSSVVEDIYQIIDPASKSLLQNQMCLKFYQFGCEGFRLEPLA